TLDNLGKFEAKGDEGSGNPNPTASSSNPPADQMEILTVKSPIPTVSLPVPTACLNDSSEPSSEARLVSKRVANQEETPSLDNILSLTNRFEDILGVSTSSDDIIRVEADASNMETSISASPTPTLRIHKDHPKSQIIDNLGKFEAKGDEGYFIGYSMSSKAFRVFNKRTRRVEENLHVEFLENKAIEQGDSPNWLFDIDSLTKSLNYVPVDAGTNSTNFLGTKDAANQEVKKNESSLRYIVLPNWAHDALLESTLSKPYEESSSQVPDGSGNHNPTDSTFNPPAEQMETLTVESPIPTVSSPVPTACLNNSSEPSNEIIRVEADVSNMETSISASPTPTLRIHKDRPKSQIIGPMDTLIQTRHKSKIVEEQSFMATIHQKTDPTLLQFCLYSCFLSQVEPKKVSDALQDPSWVEAMQEELL
nr:hypothetical protein [Tanacetum cinerariifolium]